MNWWERMTWYGTEPIHYTELMYERSPAGYTRLPCERVLREVQPTEVIDELFKEGVTVDGSDVM